MLFFDIYMLIMVFFIGACIGSFLNVCIYRIPEDGLSIVKPRSFCPGCRHQIPWYENIPLLSFLWIGGRCTSCKQPISLRYATIELFTALLFLAIWLRYPFHVAAPVYWVMAGGLIVATFVDLDHMIIPDSVSLGGIGAGLLFSGLFPVLQGQYTMWPALRESALGAAAGGGILWLVAIAGKAVFKKDAMGMGDVKLLAAMGAFLGWKALPFIILFASLTGSIIGLLLIVFQRHAWRNHLPFGPYLAAAGLAWIFFGKAVWNWYIAFVSGAA